MIDLLSLNESSDLEQWYYGLDQLIKNDLALRSYQNLKSYELIIKVITYLNTEIPEELRNKIYEFLAFIKDEFVLIVVESGERRPKEINDTITQILCWYTTLWGNSLRELIEINKDSLNYKGAEDNRLEARIVTFRNAAAGILKPGLEFRLEENEEHSPNYLYLQQILGNLTFEQQNLIAEHISFELSPKAFDNLKGFVDDIKVEKFRRYLGFIEMSRMLNPILTNYLLDFFTHKILSSQIEIITAFLEDEIEFDNIDDEEGGDNSEDEIEIENNEEVVDEYDIINARNFSNIFMGIIQHLKDETSERLKTQAGFQTKSDNN